MSVRPEIDVLRRSSRPGIPFSAVSSGTADQPLHLLGAGAGVLGDDLDQRRRRVGISLDVQVQRRVDPQPDQGQDPQDHDQPVIQAPRDDRVDHVFWALSLLIARTVLAVDERMR